jgi:hypothetical protein
MKFFFVTVVLLLSSFAVGGAVFSQEGRPAEPPSVELPPVELPPPAAPAKNIRTLISGAFSWYPTFKFGSKDPDEYLTDSELSYNVAGSVQFGLSLWRDFKFLLNVDLNGTEIEDTPLGPIGQLSGSLGFKSALIGIRTQNIAGSLVWGGEKAGTGPADRVDFGIHITMVELQYDLTSFFPRVVVENGLRGLYVGLLYLAYEGPSKVDLEKTIPLHYDPKVTFNGFGFSLGIDTLNGFLLYGDRIPLLTWDRFSVIPWLHFDLEWAWGMKELSDEGEAQIKNNPNIPPSVKANMETSELSQFIAINGILGAGFSYRTKLMDITFSLGHNFLFFEGTLLNALLQNDGLVFKVTVTF